MAGSCSGEINSQPILTGCPADTELVLVMMSTAAGNNGGYGLRYIKDLRQCFLAGLQFNFFQFTVGQGGSPISPGGTAFTIVQSNILEDSVVVVQDGVVMDRNDNTQASYVVDYSNPAQITVTFNQAVQSGETYIILFTYAS